MPYFCYNTNTPLFSIQEKVSKIRKNQNTDDDEKSSSNYKYEIAVD
jgi:hypothetical protein